MFALGNNGVSLVSSLFDLHKVSSHIWAECRGHRECLCSTCVQAQGWLWALGVAVGRQGVPAPLGGSEPPLPLVLAPCAPSLQQQRDAVLVTHRVNLCTHINP